jgi:hypothetical protein
MRPHPEISRLSTFAQRMNVLDDFEAALSEWSLARRELRWKIPPFWRLEHKRAMARAKRYWRRYAEQIRKVRNPQ